MDAIAGGSCNDNLSGVGGNDTLTGGVGNDPYRFTASTPTLRNSPTIAIPGAIYGVLMFVSGARLGGLVVAKAY
ncbi:MAG: hypothetical protein HWQ35_14075 [Nostoc sp. NMS1]|uniref:hypothetical protein n=1 Tax=unclassified Nostoc TaxID=2593658 RepID=UPI0025CEC759|nr:MULTISPECIES: hypothetical protein [unclassified Nostoc]MBN3907637.1 hypothetical protein [Nostoc sp. NMS1]MBN3992925.1 hypothetical protein [Nostoc sp. NMS2]